MRRAVAASEKMAMANLVLELKSGETMLINGAAIRFRSRTRLELVSRARFLFGKQIMSEDEARTPARRLYHALQTAYVGPADGRETALGEVRGLLGSGVEEIDRDIVDNIRSALEAGENYAALKLARGLVVREEGAWLAS